MIGRFGLPVGLSDHTLGNTTTIAAVALSACIIEKHFALDRSNGGPDNSFSLEPPEFTALCADARTSWEIAGKVDYGRKSSEIGNVTFRRSLYFVEDLEAGATIPASAVRSVQPGYGLPPKHLDAVIGSRLKISVRAKTPVLKEHLE